MQNNPSKAVCFLFFWTFGSIVFQANGQISNTSEIIPPADDPFLKSLGINNSSSGNVKMVKNDSGKNHSLSEIHICTSTEYCTCNKLVISCDFSSYPGSRQNQTTLDVFGDHILTSVKRLCFCNSPRHLRLNLSSLNNIQSPTLENIHRLDIYNLTGPLHISNALESHFNGDLYMKNVSDLHSLVSWGIGRGNGLHLENVEALECCSKINVVQEYPRPILHLENVLIGKIHSNGINSIHMWKTIIFKNLVVMHGIEPQGITFATMNEASLNVSITGCEFSNVSDSGIRITNFDNLLFAKNYFDNESSVTALELMSNVSNSSLVILSNSISNGLIWKFDAHRVINWFNYYYYWDEWTFANLKSASSTDRIVSIEYNDVGFYLVNDTSHFPIGTSHGEIVFNENVLGLCNCTFMNRAVLPDLISANKMRCDPDPFNKKPEGKCLIDFHPVLQQCSKDASKIDFPKMCLTDGALKPSMRPDKSKHFSIKAEGVRIVSTFIHDMVKGLEFHFHIHQIFQNSPMSDEKQEITGESNHPILYTFLGLFSIAFLLGSIFLVIKRRRFGMSFARNSRTESYDVLIHTTAT